MYPPPSRRGGDRARPAISRATGTVLLEPEVGSESDAAPMVRAATDKPVRTWELHLYGARYTGLVRARMIAADNYSPAPTAASTPPVTVVCTRVSD